MQILTIDVGTGTQDIYLFHSGQGIENGFKMVMPSPTMRIRAQIQAATRRGEQVLLTGLTMGGGPCQWAAEAHVRAGKKLYATANAARTFNDDLSWVENELGIIIVGENEARSIRDVKRIELQDVNLGMIADSFTQFGVDFNPQAIGVAVFDHGAAPPGVSDRRFRFDYLRKRIAAENHLSSFAFLADAVPPSMTRMQAVAQSIHPIDCPLLVMDTAPAAILGSLRDPKVSARSRLMIANIGNFHTLAFRLGPTGIEALFEHHTGLINLPRLEAMLEALADGSLRDEDVFNDHGHGALILHDQPLSLSEGDFSVAVSGPRRALMNDSRLRPYFSAPFGDMMISGCLGLLHAIADHIPTLAEPIRAALSGEGSGIPPWDRGTSPPPYADRSLG